jgi:hypothetical protein
MSTWDKEKWKRYPTAGRKKEKIYGKGKKDEVKKTNGKWEVKIQSGKNSVLIWAFR